MRELVNEPLAARTTLGVGGNARRLLELDREDEAIELLRLAREPFHVVGQGSNVVVADAGVSEPVLSLNLRGIEQRDDPQRQDEAIIYAAAGEPWDAFVAETIERGLAGLECLSGIPGLVGASPIQNVGAYGQQVSDRIVDVRAFDLEGGEVADLSASACTFGYRDSLFKTAAGRRRYVVLGVRFRLRCGDADRPRYAQLERALGLHAGQSAPTSTVREAVLELRREKSMVRDDDDPDSRSVGSFFVNPAVEAADADRIEHQARAGALLAADALMPRFDTGDDSGRVKLAAAWLIEQAGFRRGYARGPVGLSSKHALAIINRGGATASDVIALARMIHDAVAERFGVALRVEPDFLGDFSDEALGSLGSPRPPLQPRSG